MRTINRMIMSKSQNQWCQLFTVCFRNESQANDMFMLMYLFNDYDFSYFYFI